MKIKNLVATKASRFAAFVGAIQAKGAGTSYPPLDRLGDRDENGAVTKQGYDALIDAAREWVVLTAEGAISPSSTGTRGRRRR